MLRSASVEPAPANDTVFPNPIRQVATRETDSRGPSRLASRRHHRILGRHAIKEPHADEASDAR